MTKNTHTILAVFAALVPFINFALGVIAGWILRGEKP